MEAQFVTLENASRHQDVYPLAAETVLKSTYVDDSLDTVETVQDGIQVFKEPLGPLPQVRLRFTFRVFDQTTVDYAGPFTTIQGRGRQQLKRWLCVFSCLSTRAVHFQVGWGIDTDSFLMHLPDVLADEEYLRK